MPSSKDPRSRSVIAAVWLWLLLLVAAAVPGAAAARPGDRDPTFGDGGEVVTPFLRLTNVMAIDAHGRILVGGDTLESFVAPPGRLARYDASGRLDPTFGVGGIAEVPPGRRPAYLGDIAFAADGRALVAATTTVEVNGSETRDAIVVVRLEEDGRTDLSFANGEIFVQADDLDYSLRNPQILVYDDGRVGVASLVCDAWGCPGVALFRFTSDGAPLGSGLTLDGIRDLRDPTRVHLRSDDRLWLTARSVSVFGYELVLVDLDTDGEYGGRIPTNLALTRFQMPTTVLDDDDRLLAVGTIDGDVAVQRFLPHGRLDPAYATTPIPPAVNRRPEASVIAVQPDGRAIIGGSLGVFRGSADWLLTMLLPDGGIDESFGTEGRVERLTRNVGDHVRHVGVQPDGRIVVLGHVGSSVVLARYAGSTRGCGDADGDGTLTVTDGVRVLRASADLPSSCLTDFCDVDANGSTTVTDGVRVLRAAAALPATLECAPAH